MASVQQKSQYAREVVLGPRHDVVSCPVMACPLLSCSVVRVMSVVEDLRDADYDCSVVTHTAVCCRTHIPRLSVCVTEPGLCITHTAVYCRTDMPRLSVCVTEPG